MYELVLVFSLITAQGQYEDYLRARIDYEFRTETGCYLSGATDLSAMFQGGLAEALSPGTVIFIECNRIN